MFTPYYPLDESSFILTDQSYMCLMDEMLPDDYDHRTFLFTTYLSTVTKRLRCSQTISTVLTSRRVGVLTAK